ncbi:glycoside hydrolase family 113 [Thermoguttaceae bacterium LCP21S3_D4]|nr:1,4-beta-xylanase [Lachnospiraceae bacterium]MDD6305297.1 1,4-beta-xylanase [Lachnospiraceae bacterium]
MEYICGMTYAPFARKGSYQEKRAFDSLKKMKERTNSNFVILAPNGLQDTAQSEEICYTSEATVSDDELKGMIDYAKELGMRVALKPTVNCKNGTWRAHVNFFDEDVVCEPKWCNWFESYTEFQLHYARLAKEMGVEMHIAGCEMVMAERREAEWRKLIADIRGEFDGLVSYNTDKYQEHNVKWWDAVDVISSSGYYPLEDWENQLDRIEAVVKKFQKPFFFAEAGCMSIVDSNKVPNDWTVQGEADADGQADWYEAMFQACLKRDWVKGMAFWSWSNHLYTKNAALKKKDYEIYAKPAEKIVKKYYDSIQK